MTAVLPLTGMGKESHRFPSWGGLIVWFALLSIGYLPLLVRFATEQWGRPQYQFFPLIIVAAGYLAWERLQDFSHRLTAGNPRVGRVLLACATALLLVASVLWSGRVAAISAWVLLAAVAWRAGGYAMLRAMAPSGILLALAIGVPLGLDDVLLQRLREIAVHTSSGVLVWLGVPHLVAGTVLEIPGHRLLVAEACSGINSMMAVFGFTLVLSFLRHRRLGTTALLLASGVVFVLWSNMVRITGGAYLKAYYGVDILSGTAHEWASVVLFCVSMVLVISFDEFIQLIADWWHELKKPYPTLPPASDGGAHAPSPVARVPSEIRLPLSRRMWLLAAVFAFIGVGQVANASLNGGLTWWMWGASVSHLPSTAVFTMPRELAGWTRAEDVEQFLAHPEIEGKRSQSWLYRNGDVTAVLAVDFPFPGYHDLTLCYRNAGWTLGAFQHHTSGSLPDVYSSATFTRMSESGYLWFSLINELDEWVSAPPTTLSGRMIRRVRHLGRPDWSAPTYQIQIWVQSFHPLTDAQQRSLHELFLAARPHFAQQFKDQLEGR